MTSTGTSASRHDERVSRPLGEPWHLHMGDSVRSSQVGFIETGLRYIRSGHVSLIQHCFVQRGPTQVDINSKGVHSRWGRGTIALHVLYTRRLVPMFIEPQQGESDETDGSGPMAGLWACRGHADRARGVRPKCG